MKLVIVESPTKQKVLAKYLGRGWEVMATMGHIRDLPKSKMGIEVKKRKSGFSLCRVMNCPQGKKRRRKKLAAAAAKADKVIWLPIRTAREKQLPGTPRSF